MQPALARPVFPLQVDRNENFKSWEPHFPPEQAKTRGCGSAKLQWRNTTEHHAATESHHLPTRRSPLPQLTLIPSPANADGATTIIKTSALFPLPFLCFCLWPHNLHIDVKQLPSKKHSASCLICTDCSHIGCNCCCCTGRKIDRQ